MKIYLQAFLVVSILGISISPAASMEARSAIDTASSLKGSISFNDTLAPTSTEPNILILDRLENINISAEKVGTPEVENLDLESFLSPRSEDSFDSAKLPLIQF